MTFKLHILASEDFTRNLNSMLEFCIDYHNRINPLSAYTATSIKLRLSTSKAEKSNTSAKGCFISDSQHSFALVFDFSALLGDNLN